MISCCIANMCIITFLRFDQNSVISQPIFYKDHPNLERHLEMQQVTFIHYITECL